MNIFSRLVPKTFCIPIRVKKRRYLTNPYKYPFGSLDWKKEPGIELPASPGVVSEEYVSTEHTQSTGPGSSSVYSLDRFLNSPYIEKKPSITREEF